MIVGRRERLGARRRDANQPARLTLGSKKEKMMRMITRAQMEQDLADDLRWIRANDPNLEAEWDAVLADSTPDTKVWVYDLGDSNYVHAMPDQDFNLATFGQSEPRSVDYGDLPDIQLQSEE